MGLMPSSDSRPCTSVNWRVVPELGAICSRTVVPSVMNETWALMPFELRAFSMVDWIWERV